MVIPAAASFGQALGQSAASTGATGLISGALGQLFGGMNARRQWRYQQKQMKLQQQYALEQMQKQSELSYANWQKRFDYENAYNDPTKVFDRYLKAGVTPAAVLGSSGVGVNATMSGGSASMPSASGPSGGSPVSPAGFAPADPTSIAQKITTDVTGNDTAGMVAGMVASGVTAKGLNGIEAEANKLAKAPKGLDGVIEGTGNVAEDVGKAGKGLEGAAKGAESAAEDAGKVVESGSKTIDDIIDGLPETTNGKGVARNFESTGDFEQTIRDFDALNPIDVKEIQTKYGSGKVGKLSDGTTVVARPGSTTGGATLEIRVSNRKVYKIRY